MSHTPGPWGIFKGYIVQTNEDDSIPLNARWIAQMEFSGDCTEDNARLILAAPKLLHELKILIALAELKGVHKDVLSPAIKLVDSVEGA